MRYSLDPRSLVARACLSLALFGSPISCTDTATAPGFRGPLAMQMISGDGQSGPPGAQLPQPLVVKAVDATGKPIPDQVVNFVVVGGGGRVFAGVGRTDSEGRAQDRWTLGTDTSLLQTLEVRAVDTESGEKKVFATFRATFGEAVPDGPSGDPTQLPMATRQLPAFGSYTGGSLAAGQSYVDPVTGVRVWKLTDAHTPIANGEATHDYSSGPAQASRAWAPGTHSVLVRANGGRFYLADFERGKGISNWRFAPDMASDLSFTFSLRPQTPRIAYYTSGTSLVRYNTATSRDERSGRFPKSFSGLTASRLLWVHQDRNDAWFVLMPQDQSQIIAWNSTTDQTLVMTPERLGIGIDEPHLERDGRYVMLSLAARNDGYIVWDLVTDTFWNVNRTEVHTAGIRSAFIALDPDIPSGPQWRYDPGSKTLTEILSASQLSPDLQHHADQWIQSDASVGGDLHRQWVLFDIFDDGLVGPTDGWTREGGTEIYSTIPDWTPRYQKPSIGVQSVRQYVEGDTTRVARQLVRVASVPAMTEGSFHYDAATTRLHVWVTGGGSPAGRVAIRAPGAVHDGIGFYRADGSDVRLLAHHYSIDVANYWHQPRATISPDGQFVLFDSNENDVDGREDVFLVEVPVAP